MRVMLMLAAVCCVVIPVYGQQAGEKADTQQQSPATAQSPKNNAVSGDTVKINKLDIQQQTNPPDNPNKDTKKPQSYFLRLIAPENLPNLILSAMGIAGIIVAVCTLKIIERQTRATEDAAKAALLNAQAVINSERPWIVVSLQEFQKTEEVFTFRVTNKGRTPAKFISGTSDHVFADGADTLPEKPIYGGSFVYPNYSLLIQDGYFDIFPPVVPKAIIEARSISDKMFNPNQILFFYGIVVYEDVLGNGRPDLVRHETRWCFAYASGAGFIRTGSKEYDTYA